MYSRVYLTVLSPSFYIKCSGCYGSGEVEVAAVVGNLLRGILEVNSPCRAKREVCSERHIVPVEVFVGEVVAALQVALEESLTDFGEVFGTAIVVLERVALSGPEGDFVEGHAFAVDAAVDHRAQSAVA